MPPFFAHSLFCFKVALRINQFYITILVDFFSLNSIKCKKAHNASYQLKQNLFALILLCTLLNLKISS